MSSIDDQIALVREHERDHIQPKEISRILGISERALSMQRSRKKGVPAVLRAGCRPYYDRNAVITWLEAQRGEGPGT